VSCSPGKAGSRGSGAGKGGRGESLLIASHYTRGGRKGLGQRCISTFYSKGGGDRGGTSAGGKTEKTSESHLLEKQIGLLEVKVLRNIGTNSSAEDFARRYLQWRKRFPTMSDEHVTKG